MTNKPQSLPTSNMLAGLTGIDSNDDSLLDADNSDNFDLKNQLYELKSRCNAIQYEKNKLVMSYENTIKDLKHKYAALERHQQDSKGHKSDQNTEKIINELKLKCQSLSEQNDSLKRDLQSAFQKNRSTPNFNSFGFAQQMNVLDGLLQKQQMINKLESELKQAQEGEYLQLRQKITALQRDNTKLQQQIDLLESQKQQIVITVTKQIEDRYASIIRSKDKTIQSLKNQQAVLTSKLDSTKKSKLSSTQGAQQANQMLLNQLEEKQAQLVDSTVKIANLQKDNNKLKSEKIRLQQENKFIEAQKNEALQKKIVLQEEIQRIENQLSEFREASVNQKLQNKKATNALRAQIQQQKNRAKILVQQLTQQNKQLRDQILSLNDQNEMLQKKQINNTQKIQFLMRQNGALQDSLREAKCNLLNFQDVDRKLSLNSAKQKEYQLNMKILEEQIRKLRAEFKDKNTITQQQLKKYKQLQEDMKIKDDVVELMKMQKEQNLLQQKDMLRKIQQFQERQIEKQKVIQNLQQSIRKLKDDNRYLQLGNEELKEKINTMQSVVTDVDAINRQLKKEKAILEDKRKEQEREARRQGEELEKMREQEAELLQIIEEEGSPEARRFSLNSRRSVNGVNGKQVKNALHRLSSRRNSLGYAENLLKQVEDLTGKNYKLQMQLSEVQNELQRKNMDLNTKTQQITKLKQVASSPKQIDFAPIIQISKKNQFNAVVFQNKIMELQKEISSIRTTKQQQLQQYKKVCRKQMEDKYLAEIKRLSSYSHQLQKNINMLNSRLGQQNYQKNEVLRKLQSLQKFYYQRQYEYSETLAEYNQLLQRYKSLEQNYKEAVQNNNNNNQSDQIYYLKSALDNLTKNYEESNTMLTNSYDQIRKLNELLMAKENQLKSINSNRRTAKSPNQSFTSQQYLDRKGSDTNIRNFEKGPSPLRSANYTRI